MNMIEWLQYWLSNESTKLVYVLTLILIANMIDFVMGWVNAKFNEQVAFSSSKAIYGIARKIVLFILLVLFVPMALLVPEPVGIGALYVLYFGYLASEVNSILSHLRLTSDDKETSMFIDFVQKVFSKKGE